MIDTKIIKDQILLEGLTNDDLGKIADLVEKISLKKGEPVFKEGDDTKGIYMVLSGTIEINKVTPDGWKQKLALLKENHFFGELSIIANKKFHGANADALDDSVLLVINKEKFVELESSDPSLIAKIMKTIARVASQNVHIMNEKLIKLLISY